MTPYIRLRRYGMTQYVEGRTQGYRMQVEVVEAVGVSPNIFVYQVKPGISEVGGPVDEFVNIASPADLEEYGITAPAASDPRPFYRLDAVDLVFRNLDLLEAAWVKMKSDVAELVQSLIFMDNLVIQEEVEFGEPPSSSSSSSGP